MTRSTSLVASCSLVFEGFLQLLRSRLHLLKKTRVLDGYDGLVGENLEQLNLSIGEGANLGAPNGDQANGLARTDQRDGQYGAMAMAAALRVFVSFGVQIGDLYRS